MTPKDWILPMLIEQLGIDYADITPDAHLMDDLGGEEEDVQAILDDIQPRLPSPFTASERNHLTKHATVQMLLDTAAAKLLETASS